VTKSAGRPRKRENTKHNHLSCFRDFVAINFRARDNRRVAYREYGATLITK